jgi:hypothetical protein
MDLPPDGSSGEPLVSSDPEGTHKTAEAEEAANNKDDSSPNVTPQTGVQTENPHLQDDNTREGFSSPTFDNLGDNRTLRSPSPRHSTHSQAPAGSSRDNPLSKGVTPQSSFPQGTPYRKALEAAGNVPDSLGVANQQRLIQSTLAEDTVQDTPLNAARDGNEELLPRQRLSDVDQLQYQQVMESRERDKVDRIRKLDSRSPVTGVGKKQAANKFLKNHRALNFDNVSHMQVESTLADHSPAARASTVNLLVQSSPSGSDSRMEDADALQ